MHTPFDLHEECPSFLFFSQKEAIARLKNVIQTNGLGILSGEIGSGKSTIIRILASSLNPSEYEVVYLCSAGLVPKELYSGLLIALGEEPSFALPKIKAQWRAILDNLILDGKKLVIFIDESHELPSTSLLEMRFLLNHKMDSNSPFSIILSGQPRFRTELRLKAYEAISQRVKIQYHLTGMNKDETKEYILNSQAKYHIHMKLFFETNYTIDNILFR